MRTLLPLILLLVTALHSAAAGPGAGREGLAEVDRLISEQKHAAALERLKKLIDSAPQSVEEWEYAQLLARETSLQVSLHGYETALRDLKSRPWPKSLLPKALVHLIYAQSLQTYATAYSWEIRSREKMETRGLADLKAWTAEQIYLEAYRTYADLWKEREKLGAKPKSALALDSVVNPNTYPPEIRGTLRDSLSHLFAELLQKTSGWSPAQSNEVFALKLEALLEGKSLAGAAALADPKIHPLEKASYILGDLEDWHLKRGEKAAALDARLSLVSMLHGSFTSKVERQRIRQSLKARLEREPKHGWRAMGFATLAELFQQGQEPDRMIEAHRLASRGIPDDGPGAARCRDLLRQIEYPNFSLEAMRVDGQGKKSIGVSYQNLKRIYFRSYPYDIRRYLRETKGYSFSPEWRELEPLLKQKPEREWEVELPATPDYLSHRFLVTPPVHAQGSFIVVASANPQFDRGKNVMHAAQMILGDLVFANRVSAKKIEVETMTGSTGAVVRDATLKLFRNDYRTGTKLVATKKVDESGRADFSLDPKAPGAYYILAERPSGEFAVSTGGHSPYEVAPPERARSAFVYTDRSIYRPGQKVLWKAVAFGGDSANGKYTVEKGARFEVQLRDANSEVVAKHSVTTDEFGAAFGEFEIPAGKLLGGWSVAASIGGEQAIQVEEYKRPTFEVKIGENIGPARLNREIRVGGDARYYFGAAVPVGRVSWSVRRQAVLPWWCFWGGWDFEGQRREQVVASGRMALGKEGKFEVVFTPKADEQQAKSIEGLQYRFRVDIDVTDEGGETRSASRSFEAGFVAVTARLEPGTDFWPEAKSSTVELHRTDLEGAPAPGSGQWELRALSQPAQAQMPAEAPLPDFLVKALSDGFSTPDDRQQTRWNSSYSPEMSLRSWSAGTLIASGRIETTKAGAAKIELPSLDGGAYRLSYKTQDAFGTPFETSRDLIVATAKPKLLLPAFLGLERSSVKVGEKARVLVHSGLPGQRMLLEIQRSGQVIDRREWVAGRDSAILEFPVKEEDRGGLGFSLRVVNDYQQITLSKSLFVPWDNQELKLSFQTFRDRLRPGDSEKWILKVEGPNGKKLETATAQILAYMYDRSLESFVAHTPTDPLSFFPNRSQTSQSIMNLGSAPLLYIPTSGFGRASEYTGFVEDQIVFYPGYGIGGPGRRAGPRNKVMMMDKAADSEVMAQATLETAAPAAPLAKAAEPARPAPAAQVRSEFSETAFWKPALLNRADGSVELEFRVPDSVTSWSVWAHAITRDLQSGRVTAQARTVKELLVRPYLPRFLREGDEAELQVVVNNTSSEVMSGGVELTVTDSVSGQSLLSEFGLSKGTGSFSAPAMGSSRLVFRLKAPSRVGAVNVQVVARAGDRSDGELRGLPLLPGRFHLSQSRFVTLKGKDARELSFADLAKQDDPTRKSDQLVVTLDAQLFYSVLSSLPYLMSYPYECTEQTLNRFLSAGIVSSVFARYPAVEKMAREFSSRKTVLEPWNAPDPNRRLALEETPWLELSRGGPSTDTDPGIEKILDSRVSRSVREDSLKKLEASQTSQGGFPWFPGGTPSPYMTLYLLNGFSRALEFGVEVPKPMVTQAWGFLRDHYVSTIVHECYRSDSCWELVTFLNYVLSSYKDTSWTDGVFSDADRARMLAFSQKHWKEHSTLLKGYLALTLLRSGKTEEAQRVWASVMDSANTTPDEGTHWAAEERSWLWYNDTIESHAFALRAGMELGTGRSQLDGLVQWIFLNKKLNHWKSTRATAEVIYALTRYLEKSGELGAREAAMVRVGQLVREFEFKPEAYTGKKTQIVIPGPDVPSTPVKVEKSTPGLMFASATWTFSTERLPKESSGDFLSVNRRYFKRLVRGQETILEPLSEGAKLESGDEVEVHLSIRSKHAMEYVHLKDPRAAGFEPVESVSRHKYELGIQWLEEIRDSSTNFFFERLPQGEYNFRYRIRATTPGVFKAFPATVQPMYAPEFNAYSAGSEFRLRAAGGN